MNNTKNSSGWDVEEPTMVDIEVLPMSLDADESAPAGADRWFGMDDSAIRTTCRRERGARTTVEIPIVSDLVA